MLALAHLWTAVEPAVVALVATVLAGLVAAATEQTRRYFGERTTDLLRKRLDEALVNGALSADTTDPDDLAAAIVNYVKDRVPDAVKRLRASDDALFDRARATARQITRAGVEPAP